MGTGDPQEKFFGYGWVPGTGQKNLLGTDGYRVPARKTFLGTVEYRVRRRIRLFYKLKIIRYEIRNVTSLTIIIQEIV